MNSVIGAIYVLKPDNLSGIQNHFWKLLSFGTRKKNQTLDSTVCAHSYVKDLMFIHSQQRVIHRHEGREKLHEAH